MCRYGVPQTGDVPEMLLRRGMQLLMDILPAVEGDFLALLDADGKDTGLVLWVCFIAYVEAYQHCPAVQEALRPLMRAMASRLGYRQPAQMAAGLQRMPCVELLYSKQLGFACRQILSSKDSRWQPCEDWSFMRRKSPLTGYITALQFDIGEDDLE